MEKQKIEPLEKTYSILDQKVIAVAVRGGRGDDWAAYIGAVRGNCFEDEWQEVADTGSKLPYEVAKAIFPGYAECFEWRD